MCIATFAAATPAALATTGGAGTASAADTEDQNTGTPNAGNSGGADPNAKPTSTPGKPTVTGSVAKVRKGVAYAPTLAPMAVKKAIWAANKLQSQPYVYGGGHQSFHSRGYDCSGTVSYALHGGGLLKTPMDSSDFMSYGRRGAGDWITVYTNPGHAFVVIAGLRLDTSSAGDEHHTQSGPRWRSRLRDTGGYRAVHPVGY